LPANGVVSIAIRENRWERRGGATNPLRHLPGNAEKCYAWSHSETSRRGLARAAPPFRERAEAAGALEHIQFRWKLNVL
jgi:hypothetical protein